MYGCKERGGGAKTIFLQYKQVLEGSFFNVQERAPRPSDESAIGQSNSNGGGGRARLPIWPWVLASLVKPPTPHPHTNPQPWTLQMTVFCYVQCQVHQ